MRGFSVNNWGHGITSKITLQQVSDKMYVAILCNHYSRQIHFTMYFVQFCLKTPYGLSFRQFLQVYSYIMSITDVIMGLKYLLKTSVLVPCIFLRQNTRLEANIYDTAFPNGVKVCRYWYKYKMQVDVVTCYRSGVFPNGNL